MQFTILKKLGAIYKIPKLYGTALIDMHKLTKWLSEILARA